MAYSLSSGEKEFMEIFRHYRVVTDDCVMIQSVFVDTNIKNL